MPANHSPLPAGYCRQAIHYVNYYTSGVIVAPNYIIESKRKFILPLKLSQQNVWKFCGGLPEESQDPSCWSSRTVLY